MDPSESREMERVLPMITSDVPGVYLMYLPYTRCTCRACIRDQLASLYLSGVITEMTSDLSGNAGHN